MMSYGMAVSLYIVRMWQPVTLPEWPATDEGELNWHEVFKERERSPRSRATTRTPSKM
jgi:hypothetical protein